MTHSGNINSFILDVFETIDDVLSDKVQIEETMYNILVSMDENYIIDGDTVDLSDCLGELPVLDKVINDFLEDDFDDNHDDPDEDNMGYDDL